MPLEHRHKLHFDGAHRDFALGEGNVLENHSAVCDGVKALEKKLAESEEKLKKYKESPYPDQNRILKMDAIIYDLYQTIRDYKNSR